jgi:hypothetical protein
MDENKHEILEILKKIFDESNGKMLGEYKVKILIIFFKKAKQIKKLSSINLKYNNIHLYSNFINFIYLKIKFLKIKYYRT